MTRRRLVPRENRKPWPDHEWKDALAWVEATSPPKTYLTLEQIVEQFPRDPIDPKGRGQPLTSEALNQLLRRE